VVSTSAARAYTLDGEPEIRTRVCFTGPDGSIGPVPVPGWEDRPVPPKAAGRQALAIVPARDLLPGAAWSWEELDPRIRAGAEPPATYRRPAGEIEALLAAVPIFALLAPAELGALARTARPLTLGPTERLVVQGQDGDSLFVLADGELEVVLRRDGGEDVVVDTLAKGAVVGEMSLLTGAPRTATVRALDGAVVYEIGARQYGPLLGDHPQLLDVLADLMVERIRDRRERLDVRDARTTLAARIRSTLFAAR
jgi:CRP-like cAMP-binding protein